MKTIASLLTSLVVALWVVAIAILSLKNVDAVSLKFLTFESIKLPFFLLLVFSAAAGMIVMALIQPLWSIAGSRQSNSQSDDDAGFFVDDEDF